MTKKCGKSEAEAVEIAKKQLENKMYNVDINFVDINSAKAIDATTANKVRRYEQTAESTQKANKARCDKRRNRQRKLLKAKTKLAMGCLNKQCWYGKYRMPYSINYVGMADKNRYATLVAAKISETHKQ